MKISYRVLLLVLVPFSFISSTVLADVEPERKASSVSAQNVINSRQTERETERRASSSKKKSSKKTIGLTSGNTTSDTAKYSQDDCATQYMRGLDAECYNFNRVHDGGVYADCSEKTMADFYDIMDMQLSNVVGFENFAEYQSKCSPYKGYALNKWLEAKGVIETSAVKSSNECITATKKLTAAKKCYTAAIAHDGNFFEFSDLMNKTCGNIPEVAKKFSSAGDMGLANIPQMLENYSTFQFTKKAENWRSSVEVVLAGYIYEARQACGEESYDILELNQFTEDKRENILSKAKDSFVSEIASNIGRRKANYVKTGVANVAITDDAVAVVPATSTKFYNAIGNSEKAEIFGRSVSNMIRPSSSNYSGSSYQPENIASVGNVYVIENISNVNTVRARLLNIITSGDVGLVEERDNIDYAIISGLGGRPNAVDSGVYDVVSNLYEGDAFVIKDNAGNCQVLTIDENGNFVKLSKKNIEANRSLVTYISGCQRVIE